MADAPLTPEQPNLPESQCSEAGIYHHKRLVMLWSDAEAWAQAYGDACYAAGVEAGRTATPSPPVAAPPATPVTHPNLGAAPQNGWDAWTHAAQPQPAQPLTGARPERTREQVEQIVRSSKLPASVKQALTAPSTPTPPPGEKS